jgi:hypothetical protein
LPANFGIEGSTKAADPVPKTEMNFLRVYLIIIPAEVINGLNLKVLIFKRYKRIMIQRENYLYYIAQIFMD